MQFSLFFILVFVLPLLSPLPLILLLIPKKISKNVQYAQILTLISGSWKGYGAPPYNTPFLKP